MSSTSFSVTRRPPTDGERLDTKEKVLAFCERLAAERAEPG